MNRTRYEAIEASQSAIARKVLSVVPIQEHWSAKQIYSELHRLTHATVDRRVVDGCLRMLVDSGLVREHPRDSYIREMPKEDQPKLKLVKEEPTSTEIMTEPKPAQVRAPAPPNPLDRLASATKKLRDAISEIEDAALEATQAIEAANAQTTQLHQLKQLLKGIVE